MTAIATRVRPAPGRTLVQRRRTGDRELIERAQREGTPQARHDAVEALLPIARSLARRYNRGTEPLEDLEQVAVVGLLKAIDRFDLSRDSPFGAYAIPTIAGELRRHFRDKGWTVRVPRELQELSLRLAKVQDAMAAALGRAPTAEELAERLDVPVELVLETRALDSAMYPVSLDRPALAEPENGSSALIETLGAPDEGYTRTEDALTARELIHRLSDRQRLIVELRFGEEELTQTEIGERIGVSQMQVSRLLRRALRDLAALAEAEAA